MECYKVVSERYRYGTNASGFIEKYGFDEFESVLIEYPSIKKYFPRYEKGTIVESVKKVLVFYVLLMYTALVFLFLVMFDYHKLLGHIVLTK